jgi:hypothetical protein
MEPRKLNELILRTLIADDEMMLLPIERLEALADKIKSAIVSAQLVEDNHETFGKLFSENLRIARELEAKADRLSAAGQFGEAMALYLESFDLSLESNAGLTV